MFWEYRTSPTYLYLWPKFWLSSARLDQWLVITLPPLNDQHQDWEGELILNLRLKIACLWLNTIALKWVKSKKQNKTRHCKLKSLMAFRITSFFLRCVSCWCQMNLFSQEEKILQQHTRHINRNQQALVLYRYKAKRGVLEWLAEQRFHMSVSNGQRESWVPQLWSDVKSNSHPITTSFGQINKGSIEHARAIKHTRLDRGVEEKVACNDLRGP